MMHDISQDHKVKGRWTSTSYIFDVFPAETYGGCGPTVKASDAGGDVDGLDRCGRISPRKPFGHGPLATSDFKDSLRLRHPLTHQPGEVIQIHKYSAISFCHAVLVAAEQSPD